MASNLTRRDGSAMTQCYQTSMSFSPVKRHKVEADFSGGDITSNAGIPLLAQVDQQMKLLGSIAASQLRIRGSGKAPFITH